MKPMDGAAEATHECVLGTGWVPCMVVETRARSLTVRALVRNRRLVVDDGRGILLKRRPGQVRRRLR